MNASQLIPEPGVFYVMDRGFIDYARLYRFHEHGAFFVVRAKSNLNVILNNFYAHKGFPHPLRRVRIKDLDTGKSLVVLTNNFALPALTITAL